AGGPGFPAQQRQRTALAPVLPRPWPVAGRRRQRRSARPSASRAGAPRAGAQLRPGHHPPDLRGADAVAVAHRAAPGLAGLAAAAAGADGLAVGALAALRPAAAVAARGTPLAAGTRARQRRAPAALRQV